MFSEMGIVMKFVILLLMCVFVSGEVKVRCIKMEREALLSFKNGLTDDSGIISSWGRTEECCEWYGVVCSNTTRRVIRLELSAGDFDGSLGGMISSSLLELHHLTYLDMSWNDFGGDRIPEFIGSMKQLQRLFLWNSNFAGFIPPQLGNLTNLRSLDLSYNSLTSDNLDWLSSLSLLSLLNLSKNDFGGHSIPKFLGSMKQLQHLYLKDCDFSGIVPPQLGNLTNLRSLDLSYNSLTSDNLDWLSNLSLLSLLDLSKNDFGGHSIPKFIGSMKQLQHLYLQDCNFSGIVPPQLGNLTNLRSLDLSYNSLTTDTLDWLSSLSLLSFLDLSQFNLSHTKWWQNILSLQSLQNLQLKSCSINDFNPPLGLFVNSSSTSLSILGLSGNHLTASTFHWLANFSTSLVRLDLSNNALDGRIPNAFAKLNLIEHLDLSSNMLRGDIPDSLFNLSHLRVLVLYENELTGNINEFTGNLSVSLEILDLAENYFTGSMPDFRPFSALTELYLGSNKLTGSMPLSFGQLSKLSILEVSDNDLEGTVFESHFINLHNLRVLDLSLNSLKLQIAPDWIPPFQLDRIFLEGCNVGPSFPEWIQTQRNLETLDLSGAGIIDEVPTWLWSFSPTLRDLFLPRNQISGTIPYLSSTSIIDIDVTSNRFSGPIPLFSNTFINIQLNQNMFFGSLSSLCESPPHQLQFLGLSSNLLSGELPDCWEKMPNLYNLDLANNSFTGEVPRSFGSLHDLNLLQLRDNNLSGEFPSALRFHRRLVLFDVGGNKLTGEIPTWIGEINFDYLNLGGNRLHGSIPPGICNLTSIKILDVSMNNLSGKIPDCFNNFTTLGQKNTSDTLSVVGFEYELRYNQQLPNTFNKYYNAYSRVGWKGQESEYRVYLPLQKLIDFSSNKLTGNVPRSLSSMKGLRSLNLSRNCLTGKIIPDIGKMEMLESLDLSNNQLSGEIPTSLAQLHFLSFLDLSNNNLSGKIPSGTQLQSFDTSSYAGNNGLCGKPMSLCPEDRLRPPSTTPEEEEGGIWRVSFVQGFIISVAFGFIVGFWGVVGSLVLKKSWRYAYFNWLGDVGDWFYVKISIYSSKWRRS